MTCPRSSLIWLTCTGTIGQDLYTGTLTLGKGAYLNHGAQTDTPQDRVIEVVGVANASMAGLNVLLLV